MSACWVQQSIPAIPRQRQETIVPPRNQHSMDTINVGTESFRNEFVIARNPNPASRLPYVIRLPVAGRQPIVLATRETWPGPKDVFCFQLDEWPPDAEIVETLPVHACWQAGKAVHLTLKRRQRRRSMFVWTKSRGRTLVFWRTQRTMEAARPGLKVPQARGLGEELHVAVDVREQHPWRFGPDVRCQPRELPVGDYAVLVDDSVFAAIERKTPAGLASSAIDGTLSFALAELSRLPRACLVVEGRFSDLFKADAHVNSSWLMSVVAAMQWTYPRVAWMFAETRDLAEQYALRWLGAAQKTASDPGAALYDPSAGRSSRARQLTIRESFDDAGKQQDETTAKGAYSTPKLRDRRARLDAALRLADEGRIWTSSDYAAHFGVSQPTAWNDLKRLVEAGALRAEGAGRGRRYVR